LVLIKKGKDGWLVQDGVRGDRDSVSHHDGPGLSGIEHGQSFNRSAKRPRAISQIIFLGGYMGDIINIKSIISAVAFSFIGILTFIVGFFIIDVITPKVQVGKEIVEKQNVAVAIMLGAAAIGIAQIIAAAIHG